MGKEDIRLKSYLSDTRRYADLWNGGVFGGRQIVKAEELSEVSPVLDKADGKLVMERLRDAVMKQNLAGQRFVLLTVENQQYIDYSMPIRVMLQEALAYDGQVKAKIKENGQADKRHRQHKEDGALEVFHNTGERLYKFRKDDKICPVVTLVAYWGEEEWDGPKSLHDMLDLGDGNTELDSEIKQLIPELPLHFLDLSRIEHPEYFETELRPFLELYRLRNNREEFENYMKFSEESSRMDDESWDILGEITHSSELIEKLQLKSENYGEEKTMFKALEEFYNDGIAEGKAEGIIELLEELGEVSKELHDKIYAQKDLEILKKWIKQVAKVSSISEFEEKM